MIHFDPDVPGYQMKAHVERPIADAYNLARKLLPELPADAHVWLEAREVNTGTGVTGYAKAPGVLALAVDQSFADKEAQRLNLRSAVLHQTYHWVQGHTHEVSTATYETALDGAVLEGAATIFAHHYSGTAPPWSNYALIPESVLGEWQADLANMPIHLYAVSPTAIRDWSSINDDPDLAWRSIRVGAWLVNRYLAKSGKDVLELRHMPASEILAGL